ncbi:NAD(P)/FAD-dependent oxidoreductase [Salisediminibacterium selenitireducens]|uniref:FAD dependent oxidoreductase n=1 Tax=Bacillus selenitireducens (strain ATCC 700615 / DSM 15326 / MLS10) TaxID=439292 RepID=D6XXP8_BACIE|nr:FAD-dependent oxidoreductase [Salisediminibacterium selenitireducens]ADI00091.1 FAD dependent oxidoreductase [[Bacillus] selenitireducens MLS10]
MNQFTIIGGGVVGACLARELSVLSDRVVLIEKEEAPAKVQTVHNSALVHSPMMVPSKKGALKARLARRGNRMYQGLASDWSIPVFTDGGLLLAMNDREEALLETMITEAENDGDAVYERMTRKAILKAEPNVNRDVKSGLFLPEAISADTAFITNRAIEEAKSRGAKIYTGTEVTDIDVQSESFILHTASGGKIETRWVINAAGIGAAGIAGLIEEQVTYENRFVKGDYLVLDQDAAGWASHILYPIPTLETKGILVIPQPDGTTRLGPTAVEITSKDEACMRDEDEALIRQEIERMMTNVPYHRVFRHYTGIRSSLKESDDFYIKPSREHPQFFHVAGIDSPGVTAAPAIAEYVAEQIRMSS